MIHVQFMIVFKGDDRLIPNYAIQLNIAILYV